jgi:hypothetical protein
MNMLAVRFTKNIVQVREIEREIEGREREREREREYNLHHVINDLFALRR